MSDERHSDGQPKLSGEESTESSQPPLARRVISLLPDFGQEPSSALGAELARQCWASVSGVWHPRILAALEQLPEVDDLAGRGAPSQGDVVVWPQAAEPYLTAAASATARDANAFGMEASEERNQVAASVAGALGIELPSESAEDPFVLDFQALGVARWWLLDLTRAMQHVDCLDHVSLARETLAGARAWLEGDLAGARNRLRASFELLTEAREKYYPVDAYVVDLHLLDPEVSAVSVDEALEARIPFTVMAPARAIELLDARDPAVVERLREAVNEGWADVIGGPYLETDEPLRPISSLLYQLRNGAEVYRKHLDDRTVETLAGRRFSLYPMRPQVAKRFGFRFALHLGLDAGSFPTPRESKRLWESPDGSSLEALTRVPVGADRPQEGLRLPWRLARTMKDDHVAVLPLVHWPGDVAPWYLDLRRIAAYSPVLARWVTAGDFFHLTDRPFEILRTRLDDYRFPYLAQAASKNDGSSLSARVRHARGRNLLDAAKTLRALARGIELAGSADPSESRGQTDEALEEAEARLEDSGAEDLSGLEDLLAQSAEGLGHRIVEGAESEAAGVLILNPSGVTRRAAVLLPGFTVPPPIGATVHAAQLTERGVEAVVTVPGLGYAWVGQPISSDWPDHLSSAASSEGRILKNEFVSLEFDSKTGGIRSIHGPGEDLARIGQQIVLLDSRVKDEHGRARTSRMVMDRYEAEYGGPALAQGISMGRLLHPVEDRALARYRQRVRLWAGRPILEIEIELEEVDPGWLSSLSAANVWESYIACRWAWADPQSILRRCCFLGPEATEADRPETAEAIDITSRRHRTTLLFGGLAHHQRYGARMLDTLLVSSGESSRRFRLGVCLDLEHPFQALMDLWAPSPVVSTTQGPPRAGTSAWLFRVDMKNVAVLGVSDSSDGQGSPGPSLRFDLLETAGRSCRARLRCFREPVWARQVDMQGDLVVDLAVDGDSVLMDFTPRELARVEVGFS